MSPEHVSNQQLETSSEITILSKVKELRSYVVRITLLGRNSEMEENT